MTSDKTRVPFRTFLILGALAAGACASTPEPVKVKTPAGTPVEVTTQEGTVAGLTDGDIHAFKGIPYGAPVDGVNRWLPPKPTATRTGVFDARNFGPACEQTVATIPKWLLTDAGEIALYEMAKLDEFAAEEKSPDCLRLNIWTPALPDANATASAGTAVPASDVVSAPAAVAPAAVTPAAVAPAAVAPAAVAPAAVAPAAVAPVDAAPVDVAPAGAAPVDVAPPGAAPPGAAPADAAFVEAAPVEAAPVEAAPVEAPKGLPVIVHLHGGGLTSGSGAHPVQDGTTIAKQGVVFITINYRLGAIGFLAGDGLFEGEAMAGNRGFMDTVLALKWVRANVANFGGDPDNITLMGQSGGGTNVWTVLASPESEGLVRRAIVMSGPIYDYPIEDHKKLTTAVLDGWGVEVGDKVALAGISPEDASSTASTTTLVGSDEYGELSRTYLPSAGARGTKFLPDDILTAIEKGRLNNIDIMVGGCNDDAKISIIMVPLPNSFAIDIWNGYIGGLIADTDEGFEEMTKKYVAARPKMTPTRAKEQLQTDALYRVRSLKAAAIHSKKTSDASLGRTYVYQFNKQSPTYPEDLGAMHGMDLIFAMGNMQAVPQALGIKNGNTPPATQLLSDQMVEAWANFAKTGTPSSSSLPQWPEYEAGARNTMVFDTKTKVVSDPDGDLRKLWD